MKSLNFISIKLTFSLILGICLDYFFEIPFEILLINLIFIPLAVLLYKNNLKAHRERYFFEILIFLVIVSIGIFSVKIYNHKNYKTHYTNDLSILKQSNHTYKLQITEVLKSNKYTEKYIAKVININQKASSGKLLLSISNSNFNENLTVDDVIYVHSKLKEIYSVLNPHQFDYKAYLKNQNVFNQIITNKKWIVKSKYSQSTIYGFAEKTRVYINEKLKPFHFNSDDLSIINALILGQRQTVDSKIYNNYIDAGVIHILAVSGLHVGILMLILNVFFVPIENFKHGKFIKSVLIVFILWGFALIAGLSASVTRAVAMFCVIAIASNLNRPTNIYNTLAVSMFFILLVKPLFIFDVGFQLSYLAVLAIVVIDPLLYNLWKPKHYIIDKIWHTSTITLAAQVGVLPLSLFYFHQFPGLFFIANLVMIPLSGVLLGLGILVIMLACLNILPQFLALLFGKLIALSTVFVNIIAEYHEFVFKNISFSLGELWLWYGFLVLILIYIFQLKVKFLYLILCNIMCLQIYYIIENQIYSEQFVVLNAKNQSIIGFTKHHSLYVFSSSQINERNFKIVNEYCTGNAIKNIYVNPLKSVYQFNEKSLLIIDSMGLYDLKYLKPKFILLTQNPKINLNRIIETYQPQMIIADANNYNSFILQWKNICCQKNIDFHSIKTSGAFVLDN